MNEHDVFKKAFSPLHASDDTLQKVLNKTHSGKKFIPRRIAILVAAVVAVFSLALMAQGTIFVLSGERVAVLTPAKNPEQVLEDAFGKKPSTDKVPMYDAHGNLIDVTKIERCPLDVAVAKKLYGDYISDMDAVVSLGSSTFTLKNFIMDETGVGAIIWTVEDPNGIHYNYGGYRFMCFKDTSPFCEPRIRHYGSNGQEKSSGCHFTALISRNEDDTKLELVSYFGTFDLYEIGDYFVWTVDDRSTSWEDSNSVQINPTMHIPGKTLTAADGTQLTLGSQGLVIDVNTDDQFDTDKIILHFKDGTQYCLEDNVNMIYNSSGSLWRGKEYRSDDLVVLYNRLVDIDQVSSVEVFASIHYDELVDGEYKAMTSPKNYVFYP